jgi:protein O-mannosyl-transferase
VAFLFALHPVHAESVAWISEQKNTLSLVFYLAAAWGYLRFDESRRCAAYATAVALFVPALLSKSTTATQPPALLVVLWWQPGRIGWRRDVMPLLPWFVLGAAMGLLSAWVEKKYIGAEGAEFAHLREAVRLDPGFAEAQNKLRCRATRGGADLGGDGRILRRRCGRIRSLRRRT